MRDEERAAATRVRLVPQGMTDGAARGERRVVTAAPAARLERQGCMRAAPSPGSAGPARHTPAAPAGVGVV